MQHSNNELLKILTKMFIVRRIARDKTENSAEIIIGTLSWVRVRVHVSVGVRGSGERELG